MHSLPQRVLAAIRAAQLMKPGERVAVAVSGGIDSVALLRLLLELKDELGIVLSVVHFNHHIRGAESDSDEAFLIELAGRYDLEVHRSGEDVPSYAAAEHLSLEAAARRLRYRYFESLLGQGALERIATAHTLDDQAETVLLRILRGGGTRGLAGIFPAIEVKPEAPGKKTCGYIVRPLLSFRRNELEQYLRGLQQAWREDVTNLDEKHLRNRVRRQLLPLLEREFTPAIRRRLAELADIARGEEEYWQKTSSAALAQVIEGDQVNIANLLAHPLALSRRLLRAAGQSLGLSLEFEQVEEILRLAESAPGGEKRIMLGEEWSVIRSGGRLGFNRHSKAAVPGEYCYSLPVPGQVSVPEVGSRFVATILASKDVGECREQRLSPRLRGPLVVRNWSAGDRFFPAHSKSPKKLKELLQERHIPPAQRQLWPVVQSGDEIVWVRGFSCPAHLLAEESETEVLLIRELALDNPTPRRQ